MAEMEISSDFIGSEETYKFKFKRKFSFFIEGYRAYLSGLFAWRIWLFMASADIRRRYQRTILGPFWLTGSIAIFIVSIGFIFTCLWHTDIRTYLPFFSSGYILWTFISSMTIEACSTFVASASLIKQTSLPYAVYANALVARNLIALFHHLVIYVVIMMVFSIHVDLSTLLFIPGLLLISLTGSWLSLLLGLIVSRYRDITQLVMNFLQISMFITPIFWSPSQLGSSRKAQLFIDLNPLYHFIQIVRAPLLGQQAGLLSWVVSLAISVLGLIITLRIFGRYKKHLIFWL